MRTSRPISVVGTIALLAAFTLAASATPTRAQDCDSLFDEHQVLNLYVTMAPADWDALRFSCPSGICGPRPHFYWPAMLRCEDGPEIQVGIRRKNGQADPSEADPQKPAIKIDVNEFVPGQLLSGKAKLNLENGGDSSGGNGDGGSDNGIREGLSWQLYQAAGVVASRSAWVKLWVNGDYRGLYTHVEQVDKEYLSARGIDDGGWLFKGPSNDQRTREGEANPFAFNWYPFDHVNPAETQPTDWRDQTESRVDMEQLLTLAAAVNFVANKDAVVFKNNNYWYYDWQTFPEGQRKRLYLGWDNDTTMKGGDTDLSLLSPSFNNGHMAQALLRDDPGFQGRYFQIYDELIDGPLSLAATLAHVDAMESLISVALDADPYQRAGTAADQFQSARDFLTARTEFVIGQLGACGDASCDSAESPCSCPVDCGTAPAAETICANGNDDDCDNAIDCNDVDCDMDPDCVGLPLTNEIVINEVLTNSPESPDVEFVEILNNGPDAQDLTGWYLLDDNNGHDPCVLDATLQPGEYLVVAGRIDAFVARYPDAAGSLNPAPFDSDTEGQGFSLGDVSDQIRLFRPTQDGDAFVDGLTLGPQGEDVPFGYVPEGSSAPEYITSPTPALPNDLSSFHSPVCINEFLTTSLLGGVDDWIELYNRGTTAVDIGGWHLSDSASNPTKFTFPPGTIIPPGAFLSVDEVTLGFGLSSTGSEVVVLTHADGTTGQDFFDYGTQFPDVSQGRYPDGAPNWIFLATPSRGLPNACLVERLLFTSPLGRRRHVLQTSIEPPPPVAPRPSGWPAPHASRTIGDQREESMATVNTVMSALKKKGNPKRVELLKRHGANADLYGVSVADMKVIAKTIKGEQDLACDLYGTGNGDAMYLAGMVADGKKMTKGQLQSWATAADWSMISEYTVPWVASESAHGRDLALKWMSAKKAHVAACGWSTYGGIVATTPDDNLDLAEIQSLLKRVEEEIDAAPNRVRYTMNGFVIAVGAYVKPLLRQAKATSKRLGKVPVDMHGTSCNVPLALDTIAKIEGMGRVGRKRKTIRC